MDFIGRGTACHGFISLVFEFYIITLSGWRNGGWLKRAVVSNMSDLSPIPARSFPPQPPTYHEFDSSSCTSEFSFSWGDFGVLLSPTTSKANTTWTYQVRSDCHAASPPAPVSSATYPFPWHQKRCGCTTGDDVAVEDAIGILPVVF